MNKYFVWILLCLSIIANSYLFFHRPVTSNKTVVKNQLADAEKQFPHLSKRILLEFPNDLLINFLSLRKELKGKTQPFGNSFAMYFEYLPTGTSIGINEKDEHPAVSLFKIPAVMTYYHRNERLHLPDDQTTTIQPDDIDKGFGTLWRRGVGAPISLEDAVKLAIEESDNTAIRIVGRYGEDADLDAVYEGLDIDFKAGEEGTIITAKQFSSILKALYFSAVLSKEHSEKVLSYMANTKFTDKLPAGVDKGVVVAHKVGQYKEDLFLDCGIVYVPRRPYLLCMVATTEEKTATARMKMVSQTVYRYITTSKLAK